jgi:hypothetical protein
LPGAGTDPYGRPAIPGKTAWTPAITTASRVLRVAKRNRTATVTALLLLEARKLEVVAIIGNSVGSISQAVAERAPPVAQLAVFHVTPI